MLTFPFLSTRERNTLILCYFLASGMPSWRQKANDSIDRVQAIACKALEASSPRLPYGNYGEKIAKNSPSRHEKVA